MSETSTPRERARRETLARIQRLALHQLADQGADGLSLRAIARELGMVSSAIYRYYPGRDELLTALVVAAYDDLADALEAAAGGGRADRRGPLRRWRETCGAFRAWALAEPHRWLLLYGTAVPGYRAPADTVAPAGRVVAALMAAGTGGTPEPVTAAVSPAATLGRQLATVRDVLALPADTDPTLVLRLSGSFARLVGAVGLELGGHFVGAFEPADRLYDALVDLEAAGLGLVSEQPLSRMR